jgi:hypothetical protein
VDKNRAYPPAVEELKGEGTLRRRCRLRQCKYLNCGGAGPSRFEKASLAGERLPILFDGVADVTGNRGGAHDSEGASQMGEQRWSLARLQFIDELFGLTI